MKIKAWQVELKDIDSERAVKSCLILRAPI